MRRQRHVQGKCPPCKVAFLWRGRPRLKHALCPRCRRPLERTSSDLKRFPWVISEKTGEHPHEAVT